MKRISFLLLSAVMCVFCLVSCGLGLKSSDKKKEDDITPKLIGMWRLENQETVIEFLSESKAQIGTCTDITSMLKFTSKGTVSLFGSQYGENEFEFDGTEFYASKISANDITMVKEEPSGKDDLFGRYRLKSGYLYDTIVSGYNSQADGEGVRKIEKSDIVVYIECDSSKTTLTAMLPLDIEIHGNSLFMDLSSITGDEKIGAMECKISGDKLTLTSTDNTLKFDRVKDGEEQNSAAKGKDV